MEGIPVKISENYKPPRKITLPACVRNKINSVPKFETYDFKLEHSVLERLTKLEELKKKQAEKRAKKLEILKRFESWKETPVALEEETAPPQDTQILTPVPIVSQNKTETIRKENKQDGNINLSDFENDTSSPFDNIELKTINEMEELAHVLGTTNISSIQTMKHHPCENIEPIANGFTNHWQKTFPNSDNCYTTNSMYINNMSNLYNHHPISSASPSPHLSAPVTIPQHVIHLPVCSTTASNILTTNAHISNVGSYPTLPNSSHHNCNSVTKLPNDTFKNQLPNNLVENSADTCPVKDKDFEEEFEIIKGLKRDIEERRVMCQKQTNEIAGPSSTVQMVTVDVDVKLPTQTNIIVQLSKEEKEFAKYMAEMGFPLLRVARAIQLFGADELKVVEFLLQVQSLLDDKQFTEDQIEKALQANDFEEDKTRQYLDNFKQIMNLGFKEDEVVAALAKTSDPEKALDILIS